MATKTRRVITPADPELQRRLVEETAGFATAYLRWVDSTAADGLSYPRLRALQRLHCEGPAMMRAIGEQLGLSARNMTALVDSLEAEGLVVRRPHPGDRRAYLVELTDLGTGVATAAFERRVGAIGEVFEDLSPAQQQALVEVVSCLRAGLRRRGIRG